MFTLIQKWTYDTKAAAQIDINLGTPGDGAVCSPPDSLNRKTSFEIVEGEDPPTQKMWAEREQELLTRLRRVRAALNGLDE